MKIGGRVVFAYKRLDLDRDAARAHDSVPELIVANWVEARFR